MAQHRQEHESRWSRRTKVIAIVFGAVTASAAAFASNWVVGLTNGSSAQGQSASINNLTITAVATPSATNLLYPGATGDVVLKITNPNSFPVTVTGVQLPTNTTYATGYTDSALSSANAGCTSSTSLVSWNFATSTSGSSHPLNTPVTVGTGASNTLTVVVTNDATMGANAPAGCASTYFSMPSLAGVAASGGAATATTSPVTDSWTS